MILLDHNFAFKLPERFPHHPLLIEPVVKQTRVRLPHRLTPLIMIHYLSPPSVVTSTSTLALPASSNNTDEMDASEKPILEVDATNSTTSTTPATLTPTSSGIIASQDGNIDGGAATDVFAAIPSDIPPELAYVAQIIQYFYCSYYFSSRPHSRYTLLEWTLYVQEIMDVSPDYLQTFVCGAESILKKRLEHFIYGTTMKKSIKFLQMVERKYSFFYDFIAQITLINTIASASKNNTPVCLNFLSCSN